MKEKLLLSGIAFVLSLVVTATPRLAAPFIDSMVLQRERAVPVWGSASPGEKVTISFAGANLSTIADTNGVWRVNLPKMAASSEPRSLMVVDANGRCVREVKDVVVGEVWLCSGQSNMEMSMALGRTRYGDGIGAMVAQVTDKPMVRYWMSGDQSGWHRLTPEFFTSAWRSALPIYYALELHEKLGIPVGVITAAVGGSNINSWIASNGTNANLHISRIMPLGAFAMRGVLWYQGETNVTELDAYPTKLEQLHLGWKKQFENSTLPFYIVQLAPFAYNKPEQIEALPHFMENQAKYAYTHSDATITIINDIGNINDIHPNNKWLVAKRLALHALKREYGFPNVEADSPSPKAVTRLEGGKVKIEFDHAKSLYVYRLDSRFSRYAEFEMCGDDGMWKKAEIVNFPDLDWTRHGVITNNFVELVATGVTKPVKVRHAYVSPFTGCLYNQVNLPCGPFCLNVGE